MENPYLIMGVCAAALITAFLLGWFILERVDDLGTRPNLVLTVLSLAVTGIGVAMYLNEVHIVAFDYFELTWGLWALLAPFCAPLYAWIGRVW